MVQKRNHIVVNEELPARLNTQLPQGVDRESLFERAPANLNTQLPNARDRETIVPDPAHGLYGALKDIGKGPAAKDVPDQRKQFFFTGQWVPDEDPLKVGEQNYQTLRNYRYRDVGIDGVKGYTRINTTAMGSPGRGRTGIQLHSNYVTPSYVLAHCTSASGSSRVMEHRGRVPNTADFSASPLWIDDAAATLGRFSSWPQGHIGYANGMESMIWGGDEKVVNAFVTVTGVRGHLLDDVEDYTEELQNAISDEDNSATLSGTRMHFIVGSTRPLSGVRLYIRTPNASASSLTIKYWNGTAWTAVSGKSDGTVSGGVSLAQTGFVTWNDTVGTARVRYLEGRLLYWYHFEMSAGTASIYQCTLKSKPQSVKDIWDGVYRTPGMVQVLRGGEWMNYTLNAYTETPAGWYPTDDGSGDGYGNGNLYPGYYVQFSLISNDSPAMIGFEEPMVGLRLDMLSILFDTVNNYHQGHSVVKYWTGASWVETESKFDTTTDTSCSPPKPFYKSGVISWNPPDDEQKKDEFGSVLYYYRLGMTPGHGSAKRQDIWVDTIRGIPAPNEFPQAYVFPFHFQGRAMLCGLSGETNRIDYSMAHSPDVWNGDDSSFGSFGPLYFGGDERLTAAIQIYNRFGSSIYNSAIVTKKHETYLLDGYDAETWKIYRISDTIGCPAPMTLCTAEVAYVLGENVTRNIALWLSHAGPVLFDAGVIKPIRDRVSCYFNSQDTRCVNFDAIDRAVAFVESAKGEYNLLIPSGSGQTENNVWLVYDLVRNKWFEKVPSATEHPYIQGCVPVVAESGEQYVYGFRENGYMMRLEHANAWDGKPVTQIVKTSDQVPTGDIWDQCELRRVKFIADAITEATSTAIRIYPDGGASSYALTPVRLDGSARYVKHTEAVGLSGLVRAWSYAFEFETVTSSEEKGAPLLGWGYTFRVQREDGQV